MEQGKPLIFGAQKNKGIKIEGLKPVVVNLGDGYSADDLWIHDEGDFYKAQMLTRFFDNPHDEQHLPRPFGVFYNVSRPTYEDVMAQQIADAKAKKPADLDALLAGKETWEIVAA
ncbi:MAG: 2-oxoacid:ferredoxin oxidoreductase subunit beta, partial [Chitinophagaceae bacterium]